jgi:ribosomal protein S18 acetylase RimI-like enzyme
MSPPIGAGAGSAERCSRRRSTPRASEAAHIDLNTSEDDTAARALYERTGFTDRERGPDGPIMFYYERDL